MLINATGYINPNNLATAIMVIAKKYKALPLPLCVDFDSAYDKNNPTKFVARTNVDNVVEDTFYITKIEQALINQQKLNNLPESGMFYVVLPLFSSKLESNTSFFSNIALEVISIGDNHLQDIISDIKRVFVELGLSSKNFEFIVEEDEIRIEINGIFVGNISTLILPDDRVVQRGTVLSEPIFSYSTNRVR